MNNDINAIKYQACNICNALLRNINDNFISVSFDFVKDGEILVKIVLEKRTKVEDAYIDDIITEFAALQKSNCVKAPQIETENHHMPLQNLVYQKAPVVLRMLNK
jgi:hypothetical protein